MYLGKLINSVKSPAQVPEKTKKRTKLFRCWHRSSKKRMEKKSKPMQSHFENSAKQLSLYLCAIVKNISPLGDQPSQGVKSTWSIKHEVDRNNFLKAISMLRDTVK